ncbi:SusC/RagA family TonB-linked outer membrane protein [Parachryseolinea silvisoli]|uniref:SusC/RagA family TonB-linked outer membrane protein n=1 Tax=Parachryseolinea silvisoli TaxID=2873601 RepID=UPI002265B334|nr:TonB-dependent receptor [Parachryseolinea silvisoli]MCD9017655.1 TonB-dependent receptor [Parachryseolinea silvisoli]
MNRKFYRIFYRLLLLLSMALGVSFEVFPEGTVQGRAVSGKVIASSGEPLPGVSVLMKGTTIGTVSDADGNYTLNAGPDVVLVFSFIGFSPEEVTVGTQTTVNVTLTPSLETLSEVVVIGYGTVKKTDLTGSVASVKAEEITAVPTTSFDQALQGRAAGVQVMQTSGAPGAEASIRIRGISSVLAGNEPLYVIDGMLVNSNTAEVTNGTIGSAPRIGPLAAINPNDIESIEILKDASATAIYGARGANGVVLITTKHGKKGTSAVTVDSYYGVQEPSKYIDLLNAQQFAEFVNDARINGGQVPEYVNPSTLGEGTDWQKEMLRTAPIQSHQVGVSGGSEKTTFNISGGYFGQQGIVINSDFSRYNFRSNVTTEVTKKLSIGANIAYAYTRGNSVNTGLQQITPGVIGGALGMNPILPVYDPAVRGKYTYENDRGIVIGNPVAEAKEHKAYSTANRVLGNVEARYKILPSLTLKSTFGIDGISSRDRTFAPDFLKSAAGSKGEAGVATLEALTWLNENTITFDKTINNKHSIAAMAGYTLQGFKSERLTGYVFGISDPRLGYHSLRGAAEPQPPQVGESTWSMQSYLARVQYALNSKYLVTLTGRVDGSSKFGANNKYAFFPSAALAWRVVEEKWMKPAEFISELKLRTSLGIIGNQAIDSYQSLALVGVYGEGVFNHGATLDYYSSSQPTAYSNPDLKWETTRQFDIGIDAGFLNDRITLTADLYQKYTYDLLLSTPIPFTSGFDATTLNIGDLKNTGLDIDLRTVNTTGKLKWSSSINFSTYSNKITRLAEEGKDVNLGSGLILREGQPLGTFYGLQFDGIFQTDEEAESSAVLNGQHNIPANALTRARAGDRKYRNLSAPDTVINELDRTILGNALPDFTWGFNNTLSYGNFSLSVFIQGSQGNKMANFNALALEDFRGVQNISAEAGLNRWTPEHPSNRYPRALANRTVDVGTFSSAYVEDASYVRIKNITLGYNIPQALLDRANVRTLRVYVSATNLATFTKYTGYDPEGSSYGIATAMPGVDQGRYPMTKTYVVGVNIGL